MHEFLISMSDDNAISNLDPHTGLSILPDLSCPVQECKKYFLCPMFSDYLNHTNTIFQLNSSEWFQLRFTATFFDMILIGLSIYVSLTFNFRWILHIHFILNLIHVCRRLG